MSNAIIIKLYNKSFKFENGSNKVWQLFTFLRSARESGVNVGIMPAQGGGGQISRFPEFMNKN